MVIVRIRQVKPTALAPTARLPAAAMESADWAKRKLEDHGARRTVQEHAVINYVSPAKIQGTARQTAPVIMMGYAKGPKAKGTPTVLLTAHYATMANALAPSGIPAVHCTALLSVSVVITCVQAMKPWRTVPTIVQESAV